MLVGYLKQNIFGFELMKKKTQHTTKKILKYLYLNMVRKNTSLKFL